MALWHSYPNDQLCHKVTRYFSLPFLPKRPILFMSTILIKTILYIDMSKLELKIVSYRNRRPKKYWKFFCPDAHYRGNSLSKVFPNSVASSIHKSIWTWIRFGTKLPYTQSFPVKLIDVTLYSFQNKYDVKFKSMLDFVYSHANFLLQLILKWRSSCLRIF